MDNQYFYSYLHKQIPVMIILSLFPGLGYVMLSWMHGIPLRAITWYVGIVLVSIWGYRIYRRYLDNNLSNVQLKLWYKNLKLFYYVFILLWLVIFLLFIPESKSNLHYIAIFTEIGASVVASVLLIPDKKLFKPTVIVLMAPLAIYFLLIGEWYGYVLSIFACVFTWVLIYAAESSHKLLMQTNYLANHDSLTGLKNRYYFINYLQSMMNSLQISNKWSYLLLIDLDHFKTINDSLGHDIGDRLLQQVAARINESKHDDSLLARLGGDEFVIIGIEHDTKEECRAEAEILAEKILVILKESYSIQLHNLFISASIGVSLINGKNNDAGRLIKEADIAMYEAKEHGRDGVIVFDDEMEQRVEYNLEIERLLHFSIENNEISLVYQPQFNEQGKVMGAEALVRWNNENLGEIRPDVFIPIAEKTGSIIVLGRFIMETAFRTLSIWEKSGISIQQFSVNVSMRQFFYYDFVDDVRLLCKEYLTDQTRKKIIFEITESIVAEDVDKVVHIMDEIRLLGIRFSMDDFGTGYSSLSYLKRLPIDEIKIDRSFISELNAGANDQIMVSSILNMAKQFNLTVVSEGVETKDQFELLRSKQCDYYQGFYFSTPLTDSEFQDFYKNN
ncbi:MAG: EAL domain-containing protein [Gammaproteobacteria bacterium]|nr:EAL domain-containing protein [Gammaproteobacteria bacterium]